MQKGTNLITPPASSKAAVSQLRDADTKLYPFDSIDFYSLEKFGGKAKNLVIMHTSGLPVPDGFCVSYSGYDEYRESGMVDAALVREITSAKDKLGGKVAIRSSANCEDGADLSMAGVFQTVFVEDDADIEKAILSIYAQASSEEVVEFMHLHGKGMASLRMGLVIQKLIDPELAGVAYTDVNTDQLLIEYVDGYGVRLVDGEAQGSAVLIDKSGTILSSTGYQQLPLPDALLAQLVPLAGKIRQLFGSRQDIEFAYDSEQVFIVQARPLTSQIDQVELSDTPEDTLELTKRQLHALVQAEQRDFGLGSSVFCDANYSELLPRPTEMDIGLHMYVWGGSDGIVGAKQIGHTEMGYLVPPEAIGMIKYIGGHTYFSLARNAALYHIGFPDTKAEYFSSLVDKYIRTAKAEPEKASYPQMGLFLQDPTLEDLQHRYGNKADSYFNIYQDFTNHLLSVAKHFVDEFYGQRHDEAEAFMNKVLAINLDTLNDDELVDYATDILEHIRTQSYLSFVKAARLGFYYSQRLRTLLNDLFPDDDADETFSKLSQGLDGSAITDANLAIAEAASVDEAYRLARLLIGHYSTGEMLEIHHPLLIDSPEKLTEYVDGIRRTGTYKRDFERQKAARLKVQESLLARLADQYRGELEEAIRYCQTYLALRETAKYQFTREHLPLRRALVLIGERTGLQPGDIFFLYPREVTKLVDNPRPLLHLIRARKQAFDNYALLDMPSLISEDTIDALHLADNDYGDFVEATGKFLASGQAFTGVIINVDEFDTTAQVNEIIEKYERLGKPIILAARQMNLSHDPLIAQSAGLIIENAGIVAHGAQRARELGKGAIGGISVKVLKTGTMVSFDPSKRFVKKVEG